MARFEERPFGGRVSPKPKARTPSRWTRSWLRVAAGSPLLMSGALLALGARSAPYAIAAPRARRAAVYLGVLAVVVSTAGVVVVASPQEGIEKLSQALGRYRREAKEIGETLWQDLRRKPVVFSAALVSTWMVGLWFRARYLSLPMRYDEAYTYGYYVRWPLVLSLASYESPNNHLLHTLIAHLWTELAGSAEWAVRFPAFVAGCLLPPAVYVVSRGFASAVGAAVASAAAAVWPVLVEYSVNARGYTIVTLSYVLALGAAKYGIEKGSRLGSWAVEALTIAMLYTTPAAVYAAVALWSWMLAGIVVARAPDASPSRRVRSPRRRRDAARWRTPVTVLGASLGFLAVLYGYPAVVGGFSNVARREDIAPLPIGEYGAAAPSALRNAVALVFRSVPIPVVLAVLGLVVVGAVATIRKRGAAGIVGVPLAGVLPAIAVTVVQRQWPYPRVWLFAVGGLLVQAAVGVSEAATLLRGFHERLRASEPSGPADRTSLEKAVGSLCAVAAALSVLLVAYGAVRAGVVERSQDTGAAPGARYAAELLAPQVAPQDKVAAAVPADAPLMYYFVRKGLGVQNFVTSEPARVFVYLAPGQTITEVLAATKTEPPPGAEPVVRHAWSEGTIVVFEAPKDGREGGLEADGSRQGVGA